MKRLLAAAIAVSIVGTVMAQSSFTIVRPADGSKVREKVRVLIPAKSIEDGSYVGVFLGGQFVEAVVPPIDQTNKNYRVYTLDTKGRKIPDGELQLELVKYAAGDQPRIEDRSSVTVTVGNNMNVPIPAGGVFLRYGFTPGTQLTYKVMETTTISTLSGLGNSSGGRAAQFPESETVYRMMYAVDNVYGNGDALVRMQFLPNKGKDYTILTSQNNPEPHQVFDYQMHPVYMKVDKTGRPTYMGAAVPEYFGFSEGPGVEAYQGILSVWPLPVLPSKKVTPGGSPWQVGYQMPMGISVQGLSNISQVTKSYPARGEFVSAEWEMGHPCAKIRNWIAEGTTSFAGQKLAKAGAAFGDDKVALDETVYFALDIKKIIKMVRSIQIDRKVKVEGGGGTGAAAGGTAAGTKPGLSSGGLGNGGGGGADDRIIRDMQRRGGLAGAGGSAAPGAGPQAPATSGGQGGPGRSGGAGAAPRTQYLRLRYQQVFLLEQ